MSLNINNLKETFVNYITQYIFIRFKLDLQNNFYI